MTRASATKVLLTLVAAGSLAACSAPPPPPPPAARPLTATLPPGPIANISVQAMESLVKTVLWQGCTARLRAGATEGTTTMVSICAADYARGVGKGNNNNHGIVMGRMINRGSVAEKRFGLSPGATSYIVGFPKTTTADTGLYAIIEIPPGGGPADKVTVLQENRIFIYCEHPSASNSSADFRRCEEGPEYASGKRSVTDGGAFSGPSASPADALSSLDGPAWLSCRSGCCTTEAQ